MRRLPLVTVADKLENAGWLDPAAGWMAKTVKSVLPWPAVRDVLHGVPLGHPLHPLMIVVPLGAWVSAAVLDVLPGNERAARTLVGVGVAAAGPTALAGAADFSQLDTEQRRTGIVHQGANALAVGLYSASWLVRGRGRTGLGRVLAFTGLAVTGAGGFLGGHLSYRQGAGVNRNGDFAGKVPEGWHSLGPAASFASGVPQPARLGTVNLMVLKRTDGAADGAVSVLADTCSHLGGPLHEGELRQVKNELCIVCPWHGSTFSVQSGEVVHGPATSPQPVFSTRIRDGLLEVSVKP
ncbi:MULTISPECIES: Rieske 2Fe-2S domain-containing protein [unclassified Arthrobacter]|uniref:Rieske 2Fe-2S domain-containing protein n=1 Tax=unclassified Arthrobacter TaxID=235627 RepID=UPI0021068147|nr:MULTISPECIES: Rieske 2Fe-2S domain-containing protein [unclassified Arthrobacter]MCQ1946141.1 Rieske 2Fe-2S domain-containing protein [Arthrobacter sp. zg-Y1116]MCQ1994178.1 Rieske 2Fe-2S domain-containing protein [Arthrobacter sp. zg-Y1171]UWX81722.1 Rieske 2Fe-2S domain-containing protein [Arthrobacter sp. zg-Y1171]